MPLIFWGSQKVEKKSAESQKKHIFSTESRKQTSYSRPSVVVLTSPLPLSHHTPCPSPCVACTCMYVTGRQVEQNTCILGYYYWQWIIPRSCDPKTLSSAIYIMEGNDDQVQEQSPEIGKPKVLPQPMALRCVSYRVPQLTRHLKMQFSSDPDSTGGMI